VRISAQRLSEASTKNKIDVGQFVENTNNTSEILREAHASVLTSAKTRTEDTAEIVHHQERMKHIS